MFSPYFSEREGLRESSEKTYQISQEVCMYIYSICSKYFKNMKNFGEECPDGNYKCGISYKLLMDTLKIEIPNIDINIRGELTIRESNMYAILGFIEFVYKNIVSIKQELSHDYFCHTHYIYSQNSDSIKEDFINDINDGFDYAGLLYKINNKGIVERTINNDIVVEDIRKKIVNIKKKDLKALIETAIKYHRSKNEDDWKTATEKIWDAFENMKTYYTSDKKESVKMILKNISSKDEHFKSLIENEFKELTDIGNKFHIRHFETDKTEIRDVKHYDYLFNRCLSVINLTLPYLN